MTDPTDFDPTAPRHHRRGSVPVTRSTDPKRGALGCVVGALMLAIVLIVAAIVLDETLTTVDRLGRLAVLAIVVAIGAGFAYAALRIEGR